MDFVTYKIFLFIRIYGSSLASAGVGGGFDYRVIRSFRAKGVAFGPAFPRNAPNSKPVF
jgi:hypothetical protein